MAQIPNAFAGGGNASLTVPVNLRGTGTNPIFGAGTTGDTNNRVELDADGGIRWGSGAAPPDTLLSRTGVTTLSVGPGMTLNVPLLTITSGFCDVSTVGKGFAAAEGTNAKQNGGVVLAAGTNTVANTSVTANSRIFVTSQVAGGTVGGENVSARTAGTSFTITSTNAADTSTVAYEIFEPG